MAVLPAEPIPEHQLVISRRRMAIRIAARVPTEGVRLCAFVLLCWLAALFAAAEVAVGWMYRIPDDPLATAATASPSQADRPPAAADGHRRIGAGSGRGI
jgi:hypothetical protein